VIDEIFGHGNTIKINRFKTKLFDAYPNLRWGGMIKTYVFINFALYDYYRCRRAADRDADDLKSMNEIAGIDPRRLNMEQAAEGVNRRLQSRNARTPEIHSRDSIYAKGKEFDDGYGAEDEDEDFERTQKKELNGQASAKKAVEKLKDTKTEAQKQADKHFRRLIREIMENTISKLVDLFVDMDDDDRKFILISRGRN